MYYCTYYIIPLFQRCISKILVYLCLHILFQNKKYICLNVYYYLIYYIYLVKYTFTYQCLVYIQVRAWFVMRYVEILESGMHNNCPSGYNGEIRKDLNINGGRVGLKHDYDVECQDFAQVEI